MTTRLHALQRVEQLYRAVKSARARELTLCALAVDEARQGFAAQGSLFVVAQLEGRSAVEQGSREDFGLAQARKNLLLANRERLQRAMTQRETAREGAKDRFMESHFRRERLRIVVSKIRLTAAAEANRRTQAAADDRFLSRRRWLSARE